VIKRDELVQYLQDFLSIAKYNDYAPNGLQVEGNSIIKRICTAVTASADVIGQAVNWQADALLVHHGYFWRGEDPVLTGMKRQRITNLLTNNINLMAYHLPLDCHLELGNNACLAKLFPVHAIKIHKIGSVDNLLWSGTAIPPITADALAEYIEIKLNRKPLHIIGNNKPITSLAWCSGGAQDYIEEAYKLGVDAYISGEVSERTYYQAKELGIHYYACGHHATERYGIQALGHYLASTFQLEHLYIDSDNPI
jgi:dinuclear metal center YbgI/SA1388 family protein